MFRGSRSVRGGVSVSYTFPQDGEYDIQVRLARNRTGDIGGLLNAEPQAVELLIDREIAETFMVVRPNGPDHSEVDKNFKTRILVSAGPHDLGVTFPKISSSLLESERQPLQSHFNEIRHPRLNPAVYQVTVTGPYATQGPGTHQVDDNYLSASLQKLVKRKPVLEKYCLI